MTTTTTTLDPTLAALLDRHGVPHSVDGLLAALEPLAPWFSLKYRGAHYIDAGWIVYIETGNSIYSRRGPTPITALARAFAALVESEEQ